MRDILEEAKASYDMIVIDSPPVLAVTDCIRHFLAWLTGRSSWYAWGRRPAMRCGALWRNSAW